MGTAVRNAGERVARLIDQFTRVRGVQIIGLGSEEFDIQVTRQRQVHHDVDDVLALFPGDLAD